MKCTAGNRRGHYHVVIVDRDGEPYCVHCKKKTKPKSCQKQHEGISSQWPEGLRSFR